MTVSPNAQLARACELHDAGVTILYGEERDSMTDRLAALDDAAIDAAISELRAAGYAAPVDRFAGMSIVEEQAAREAMRPVASSAFHLDSAELARRFALNPFNMPRVADAPAMNPHDHAAACFEAQGRKAYPHGRNPYTAGTMANTRWARGWHQADAKRSLIDALQAYHDGVWDHPALMAIGPIPVGSMATREAIFDHYRANGALPITKA